MRLNSRYIVDFPQIYRVDKDLVGKKAHELGTLWKLGIPLPNGFVITAEFHKEFLHLTSIDGEIKKVQTMSHPAIAGSLFRLFEPIQKKIMYTHIPQNLVLELHKFYRQLSGIFKEKSLNVFSSSFNNESTVFTNVRGDANLILKIKTIWSLSLEKPIAIAVQENIKSEIRGKIQTDNPTSDKKLTKEQMNKLINYCKIIQKHFYFPYEIEYVVKKSKIFITKISPFTGSVNELPLAITSNNKTQKPLVKGIPVNPGIVTGTVKILRNKYNAIEVKKGEIIVLPNLDSTLLKRIKNAKAIVVDSVLPNSFAKTLYRRDFQIPTVEGAKNATHLFQNGSVVTVNGASGEIYSGGLVY